MDKPFNNHISKLHKMEFEISTILASFSDINSAAPYILETIGEGFGWKIGFIWILNDSKDALTVCGSWSINPKKYQRFIKRSSKISFSKGRGLPGKTWEKGEAQLYQDIEKSKNFIRRKIASKLSLKVSYCFPVQVKNEVLGIVELLTDTEPNHIREINELFDTVGFQIAHLIKRQEVETHLKKTISQLRAIFRSVPDGMTVENRDGEIIYANDAVAKILGFNSADEIVGKNIKKIFRNFFISDKMGKRISISKLPAARVFRYKTDIVQTLNFKNLTTEEERWLTIKATGVDIGKEEPEIAVKVFQDITEEVEEDKRKQIFVGLVSHEIKNPLTSISAFNQLLIRRIKQKELHEALNHSKSIEDQLNKVTKIINDLMDFTRITGGLLKINPEKIYIDDSIDRTINGFAPTVPTLTIKRSGRVKRYVFADESRISQVLLNLLNNAAKYASSGKKIIIKSEVSKNEVVISVKDFGPGIPSRKQKEIFRLFTRGDREARKSSGLGIGLYIASAIIKSHNGKMWVKSKSKNGATFSFTLPIAPEV